MTVYSPQFSNFVKFILKIMKTVVQACELLKSLSKKPWGISTEILLIYCFLLHDEGGENKIYQFLGFSFYFWKFWLRLGGLSSYGTQKGDEGADTDLIFQIACLMGRTTALDFKAAKFMYIMSELRNSNSAYWSEFPKPCNGSLYTVDVLKI